jgi:hypothetical protein
MKKLPVFYLLLLLTFTYSCDKDDDEIIQTEFTGSKVNIGDGQAWSFIETNEAGDPIAIGVQFEADALVNLPSGSSHADEFVLSLPTEISVEPYDHITMDWNEHGHPPLMIYDLPHFDFHYYFMSDGERDAIGPFDTIQFDRPLDPEYLAPMYIETPGGVPRMGAHIIDGMSPEIAGTGIFTHTFIYGKYDAKVNFLEPMVTKAFLESKSHVHQEIRRPQAYQTSGYYPGTYTIDYDADSKLYTVLLTDLVKY